MSYDDPTLKEFAGYFEAKEPGRRERASNWAIAIGLQKVDGLLPSDCLVSVAKKHIEGERTSNDLFAENSWYFRNALVRANYENPLKGVSRDFAPLEQFFRNLILGETKELKSRYLLVGLQSSERKVFDGLSENGCQKKVVRKPRQKTSDKLLELLKSQPHLSQVGMAVALGISRQAVQKHLAKLKSAGRLRRIGPDKGGHWEVKK